MVNGRQLKAPTDVDDLNGADKVAALLLTMNKPLAERIIKQLEDRELRTLARSASRLPAVSYPLIGKLVDQLARDIDDTGAVTGSSKKTEDLLSGAVSDEDINEIMGELSGQPSKRIWNILAGVLDEKLAGYLASEQPQVAASILSKLDVEKASAVIQKLDPALQTELCARLVAMRQVGDAASKLLTDRLAEEMLRMRPGETGQSNHARLGAILNRLDKPQIHEILSRLSAISIEDAKKVKKHIFTFEDVTKLLVADRSKLLEEIPADRLVLALRDCSPELQSEFLVALSPRSRRIVEAELASNLEPARDAIISARLAIAAAARSLIESSVISAPADDAGDH